MRRQGQSRCNAQALAAVFLTGLGACHHVRSSGTATGRAAPPNAGEVVVRATDVPEGALQVGVAQAYGTESIELLVPAFAKRVGALGGNFGKIDDITTKFETRTWTESYTYSCGTQQAPRQCTGTRTKSGEVATTTVVGRAFRVEGQP